MPLQDKILDLAKALIIFTELFYRQKMAGDYFIQLLALGADEPAWLDSC